MESVHMVCKSSFSLGAQVIST